MLLLSLIICFYSACFPLRTYNVLWILSTQFLFLFSLPHTSVPFSPLSIPWFGSFLNNKTGSPRAVSKGRNHPGLPQEGPVQTPQGRACTLMLQGTGVGCSLVSLRRFRTPRFPTGAASAACKPAFCGIIPHPATRRILLRRYVL